MRPKFSLATLLVVVTVIGCVFGLWPRKLPPKPVEWKQLVTVFKTRSLVNDQMILEFWVQFRDGRRDIYTDLYWPNRGLGMRTANIVNYRKWGSPSELPSGCLRAPEPPEDSRTGWGSPSIPKSVQQEYQKVFDYVDHLVDIDELEPQPYVNPNGGDIRGRRFSFPFPDGMFKSVSELIAEEKTRKINGMN